MPEAEDLYTINNIYNGGKIMLSLACLILTEDSRFLFVVALPFQYSSRWLVFLEGLPHVSPSVILESFFVSRLVALAYCPTAYPLCATPLKISISHLSTSLLSKSTTFILNRECLMAATRSFKSQGKAQFPTILCDCYPLMYGDRRYLLHHQEGETKSG